MKFADAASATDVFLAEVHAFLRRTGMSRRTFGVMACGDTGLVTRMEQGRRMRASTFARIRHVIRHYQGAPTAILPIRKHVAPMPIPPEISRGPSPEEVGCDRLLAALIGYADRNPMHGEARVILRAVDA